MFASSVLVSTAPAAPAPLTQVLPVNNHVAQNVTVDGTLGDLAQDYYGDANQWTTLWNDNPWIADPDVVHKNSVLSVRTEKPAQPEALAADVKVKADKKEALKSVQAQTQITTLLHSSEGISQVLPTPQPLAPQPVAAGPQVLSDDQINFLGSCEAGMDPAKNTGNGYYGAFQFSYGTWKSMNTGYERADLAPIEVQKAAVQRLVQRSSIHTQFPACASRMRNAGLI